MTATYIVINGKLYRSSRLGFVWIDTLPTYLARAVAAGSVSLESVIKWHEEELQARQAKRASQGLQQFAHDADRVAAMTWKNRSGK